MPRTRKLDQPLTQQEKEIVQLREKNWSYQRIGDKLGIGKTLAHRYYKRAEMKMRKKSSEPL